MADSDSTSLVPVVARQFGADTIQTVSARELHAFLEVGKDFSTWINGRIEQYGFTEGADFVLIVFPQTGENSSVGRPAREYALTLGMAKELSMVERNAKGKQARLYFIDCERRAMAPQFAIPKTYAAALLVASQQAERAEQAEAALAIEQAKVEVMQPKAEALDEFYAAEGEFYIGEAAKNFGVMDKVLRARMIELKWLVTTTQASAWAINREYMRQRFEEKNGRAFPVALLTPSGLTVLRHLHRTGELFTAYVPRHLLMPVAKDGGKA